MVVLPLAIIALFYTLYFSDSYETLEKLKKENNTLNEEIARADKIAAQYEQIKSTNLELQRKMEYLKTLIPTETEVIDVLKRVSEQGIQKGLQISLWRPKGKTIHESKEIYQIPVEVKIKGKYHNFGVFFSEIAKIERIININTLEFKAGNVDEQGNIKTGEDPTTLNANLTVATYSLIPEEERKKLKEKEEKPKK